MNLTRLQKEESYKRMSCNIWPGHRVVFGVFHRISPGLMSDQKCLPLQQRGTKGLRHSQVMNTLKAQLLEAFREQMEMCHSLMELENTNTELHVDTCRHLLTTAEW